MSRQEELLARVAASRAKVTVEAHKLAVRASIILTRTVFLGVLVLPIFQPNTFYIIRAGHLSSAPEVELHARSDVAPISPAKSPGPDVDTNGPPSEKRTDTPPTNKAADVSGPNLPASTGSGQALSAQPAEGEKSTKPVPPDKQSAPAWTEAEISAAKDDCTKLFAKISVVTEELPPAREGICGAPAPRLLKSVGEGKVKFEPAATLNCHMIAGLNSWIMEKVQPAAQKNFSSPVVKVVAESYSCRNRYGLARAPISEHALMNAIDVSAFVLENGKIIRVSKSWGPTADQIKREQQSKNAAANEEKPEFQLAASKLGAHDIAKRSDDKGKSDPKQKPDEKPKPESPEELKVREEKQAMSAFLHQAHDAACDTFDTVLGPDTNDAHHDHLHLDMRERKGHFTLCE